MSKKGEGVQSHLETWHYCKRRPQFYCIICWGVPPVVKCQRPPAKCASRAAFKVSSDLWNRRSHTDLLSLPKSKVATQQNFIFLCGAQIVAYTFFYCNLKKFLTCSLRRTIVGGNISGSGRFFSSAALTVGLMSCSQCSQLSEPLKDRYWVFLSNFPRASDLNVSHNILESFSEDSQPLWEKLTILKHEENKIKSTEKCNFVKKKKKKEKPGPFRLCWI